MPWQLRAAESDQGSVSDSEDSGSEQPALRRRLSSFESLASLPEEETGVGVGRFREDLYEFSAMSIIRDSYFLGSGKGNLCLRIGRIAFSLLLLYSNIIIQVFLISQVKHFITARAVHDIREVYSLYEEHMYEDGKTFLTANGKVRGMVGHFLPGNFEGLDEGLKEDICQFSLSQPYFLLCIIFIWALTCINEFDSALQLWSKLIWGLETVSSCTDSIKDMKQDREHLVSPGNEEAEDREHLASPGNEEAEDRAHLVSPGNEEAEESRQRIYTNGLPGTPRGPLSRQVSSRGSPTLFDKVKAAEQAADAAAGRGMVVDSGFLDTSQQRGRSVSQQWQDSAREETAQAVPVPLESLGPKEQALKIVFLRDYHVQEPGPETNEREIVGITRWVKATILCSVILPQMLIAGYLLWLGSRWMTATNEFTDLLFNSCALGFIFLLKDLFYMTIVSERNKLDIEHTVITPSTDKEAASCWNYFQSGLWVPAAGCWCYVYMFHLQAVLPEYNWDVHEVCTAWVAASYAV